VHWVLYNIPPETTELAEGISTLPPGTIQVRNDNKVFGYGAPCPPVGKGRHRYFHKLYALDAELPDLGASATEATVLDAMDGHVLGGTQMIGTIERSDGDRNRYLALRG